MTAGWPALLSHGAVSVRPLRRRDGSAWVALRLANEDWLRPWEATPPGQAELAWGQRHGPAAYAQMLRRQRAQARAGSHLPFGVFYEGRLAGQLNVGEIVRGAFRSAFVGYWVAGSLAGRGITPVALALVADHCFTVAGLHRLEANIRPENTASLRVVSKLGFCLEGRRRQYLAIDGDWRDHLGFALLADDFPSGVLAALLAGGPVE
ncbi:MAG TPA: GNAT family protein [Mycobacteriales bacterium]|jgi:ribosomal-protein-alanine N-acetyltransferase|nr:GNAT family protein [Mycobacteriales bacterium]